MSRIMSVPYAVKTESEPIICQGCLSADRSLEPLLDNAELFIYLLEQHCEGLQFSGIMLCWECTALLQNVQKFKFRIQQAQLILKNSLALINTNLSKLSIVQIEDAKITIKSEETVECDFTQDAGCALTSEKLSFIDKYDNENDYDYCDALIDVKEVAIDELKNEDDKEALNCPIQDENPSLRKKPEAKKTITKAPEPIKSRINIDFMKIEQYSNLVYVSVHEIDAVMDKLKYKLKRSATHRCQMCRSQFKRAIDVKRHTTFKHLVAKQQGPYVCLVCNTTVPTANSLEAHWVQHNALYRCSMCPALRFRRADINMHVKEHVYSYTCKKCGMCFYMRRDFRRHYKAAHRSRLSCEHCERTFGNKRKIERHMMRFHLPPKCHECKLTFKTNNALYRHTLNTHDRPPPGPDLTYCVECDKQFKTIERYKSHLRQAVTHVPRKKISVPCPECGKMFSRKNYLNNHYRLFHLKSSKYYCDICDKYYANGYGLRLHKERVHDGIKPPKDKICDTCGMAFSTGTALRRHVRTHTGERPYKCPACPAAFTQATPLKSHLRTQHKIY